MQRRIKGFIWLDWIVDKLDWKHGVDPEEVEEAFFNPPYKIRRTKADNYLFFGRSQAGRYLFIVFVWQNSQVKVISARDMTQKEKRYYGRS